MADNYILIGMPGSGKSSIGVELAKELGFDFIDTDILMQKQEGCRLEEIMRQHGREGFLDIEADVLCSLDVSRTVIATGGSVIYRDNAMQHLKTLGTVIHLQASLAQLLDRLGDLQKRGVALQAGQSFYDLYQEREALYRRYADLRFDEGGLTLRQTLVGLVNMLTQST